MAASSTHSSLAPTDFKINTSFEETGGAISVAVERCQLCLASRRPFTCTTCVRTGNFMRSKSHFSERYSEKLNKWENQKKERLKLLESATETVSEHCRAKLKRNELDMAIRRVILLKHALKTQTDLLKQERATLEDLNEKNRLRTTRSQQQDKKTSRISRYINQTVSYIEKQKQVVLQVREKLCCIRKEHIRDLVQFIFPIKEIHNKNDGDSLIAHSTVSALAEARRTSYIGGRWVYSDNGGEQQYQIVEPFLPGNGEYTAYNLWLLANKDAAEGNPTPLETNQHNSMYTIGAALSYTTQLLCIIAYFLDVHLPKRLSYSEFCGNELSEAEFSRAVLRLNENILYLCCTQHIEPQLLHPKYTIHNLLVLLSCDDLGRGGPFDISEELLRSMDSLQAPESEHDSDEEEEEVNDWERVPTTIPEDIPRQDLLVSQAASTSGLMSSAAASVASLWRGVTGHIERKS